VATGVTLPRDFLDVEILNHNIQDNTAATQAKTFQEIEASEVQTIFLANPVLAKEFVNMSRADRKTRGEILIAKKFKVLDLVVA